MQGSPHVDIDYCQYSHWGYKRPTRFWGGQHVTEISPILHDLSSCPNVIQKSDGRLIQRESLGGNHIRVTRMQNTEYKNGEIGTYVNSLIPRFWKKSSVT